MKWPWTKPKPLPIPPYAPPIKPVEPKEPSVVVEEVDTTDLSATGVHRAWRKLTGKGEPK